MDILLEGYIVVKEAIMEKSRDIKIIYIDDSKRTKKSSFIKRLANNFNIKYRFVKREIIDEVSNGKTHGGIIAICGEKKFVSNSEFFKNKNKHKYFYLTGIEDPFNLGYSIRSIYAMGFSHIILDNRNWSKVSGIISKSSAGVFEKAVITLCDNENELVEYFSMFDIKVICSMKDDDAVSFDKYTYPDNYCIVIGGEKRGISKKIISISDKFVYINYQNDQFKYSLPTSICAAIISYELGKNL